LVSKKENKTAEVTSTATIRRKSEHLRIVAENDVRHSGSTFLEDIHLLHQALPDLNLEDIDLSTQFFGRKLSAPLMITSMTGGAEFSEKMNRGLAEVAEREGIAFAVGSQRVMLRHPEVAGHFAVRKYMPSGVLLGNIGAVQLQEYSVDVIVGLVDQIEADGMCVHLNAAQELVQTEGHRQFRGLLDFIARLLDRLKGRLLVKETGAGMSPDTIKKLDSIGVPYIDVSGSGGTSWTKVEMYRANTGLLRHVGETFADWGVPTAFSIIAAREICGKKAAIIASGGIKNGLDVARAIAAGADIGGLARPILLSFLEGGVDSACSFVERIKEELRIAMLLTDAESISALAEVPRIYTGRLREWLLHYGWLEGKADQR
jgi:isopentenyl-diphosphate delta-isomerase